MRAIKETAVPKDKAKETSKSMINRTIPISIELNSTRLTDKESLSFPDTFFATSATVPRTSTLTHKKNRYTIPETLILEKRLHPKARHIRPNSIKSFALITLTMVLYISHYYKNVSTGCFKLFSSVNYSLRNIMANITDYFIFMRANLLNHSKKFFIAESTPEPIIMSTVFSYFLAVKLWRTNQATVELHRSQHDFLPYITANNYRTLRTVDNNFPLNRYKNKPAIFTLKNFALSNFILRYILILRDIKSAPDTTPYFCNRNLKPIWRNLSISFFNFDGIKTQYHRIGLIFQFAFKFPMKSLSLLRRSGIKLMCLFSECKLEVIKLFLNQRLFDSGEMGKFSFNGFLSYHLYSRLCLNICLNGFVRDIARRRNKIAICPQRWEFLQVWELLSQVVGTSTLDGFNKFVDNKLWIDGYKKVQMLWHYLKSKNVNFIFPAHFPDNFIQSLFNFAHKDRLSTLRTKYNMIVHKIHLISGMPVFHSVDRIQLNYNIINREFLKITIHPLNKFRNFLACFSVNNIIPLE